ncbi:hormonally up-regulated neu tumor-associated kinase homolog A-like [Pecten maximus]|uniref:hormonally up-regulated neu tumor-associated kinase homolog A-like n=1 Tax=Pecten maximus TaxID=6579 RepID=UPI001458591F|nr:hormonally up-regulated neu tumor-associated kinase homolog A-like [Pecten maximus]XP_033740956.1 hormonally up-regulated neu tumor-associated kinase homolog A-like [Pecten maximus]
MTVTSSLSGYTSYLPPRVVDVPREAIRSFHHSKKVGNYLLGKTIGEGSFAKVKEALHVPTGELVAIKVIDKKRAKQDSYVRKNLRREGKILQLARHPNIVQLFEIMETENSYYLVTELCKGGDLMDYICQRKKLEEREAKKFIRQIVSAIEYLHRLGILHRDLKVENLLLDESRDIKIIDFGLSNTIKVSSSKDSVRAQEYLNTQCGSPAYAAPELLGRKKYGPQVDVWSIGVNMYAMLTGNLPFTVDPFNIKTLYNKMLSGQTNPLPENVSKECRELLKRFLTPEPDKRITLEDTMRHSWVAESKGVPMERAPCPNKLRNDELDDNIMKHMTESQGFRLSEVIRFVIGNIPSPALAMYHILHRKLARYMADMRVKGKVSAMDSPMFGHKKVSLVFQKIKARRNSANGEDYQATNKFGAVNYMAKKRHTKADKTDDVKITDIENDDNTNDQTKTLDREVSDVTKADQLKQSLCKSPLPIRRETTYLPIVPGKVIVRGAGASRDLSPSPEFHIEDIGSDNGGTTEGIDSHSTVNKRSNYRPHMMPPRRHLGRVKQYLWEDPLPSADRGNAETADVLVRRLIKRCNTDLTVNMKGNKPRFQRAQNHPDNVTHQMCNGQNNVYIRRTEVKIVNNKKLIHLDYSPCGGNKDTKQVLTTAHGANHRGLDVPKPRTSARAVNYQHPHNHHRSGQALPLYNRSKSPHAASIERITALSSSPKPASSKGTLNSELSSLLNRENTAPSLALPNIMSPTECK